MEHPLAASALHWGQSLRTPAAVSRTSMPQAKATRQPAQARSGGAASSSPPSLERCCSLPGGAAATPPGHTALPAHCCAQGSAEQRLPSSASTRRSAKPCTKDTDEDASPWQQTAHARWHHNHTRGRLRTAAVCFHRTDQRVDVGELREHAEQQAEEDDPGQQLEHPAATIRCVPRGCARRLN